MTGTTIYDEWKEQMLRDFPRLKTIPHYVDALVDCYKKNPKLFKKKALECKDEPVPEKKPKAEYVLFGVTKQEADEAQTHPVSDGVQQAEEGGECIEVSNPTA